VRSWAAGTGTRTGWLSGSSFLIPSSGKETDVAHVSSVVRVNSSSTSCPAAIETDDGEKPSSFTSIATSPDAAVLGAEAAEDRFASGPTIARTASTLATTPSVTHVRIPLRRFGSHFSQLISRSSFKQIGGQPAPRDQENRIGPPR